MPARRTSHPSWWWLPLGAVIVAGLVARFAGLAVSPPGFFLDEAAISAQVICVATTGHDAGGRHFPLFAPELGGGRVTPPEIYIGAAWVRVFGHSVVALRSLAAVATLITIAALALIPWKLGLGKRVAWIAVALAVVSPWGFQFGRIAWDQPLGPCFLMIGVLLCLWPGGWKTAVAGGASFALAAYAYPPLRAQVALVAPALILLRRTLPEFHWRDVGAAGASAVIVALPLIVETVNGSLQWRYDMLSLASSPGMPNAGAAHYIGMARLFVHNYLLHFSWRFIALSGDLNLRHSSQLVGEWSPVEIVLVGVGAVLLVSGRFGRGGEKRDLRAALLAFAVWGFLAALVAPSLTYAGVPHALRGIGAWPFLGLACAIVADRCCDLWPRTLPVMGVGTAVYFAAFLYGYFTIYPERARDWFNADMKDAAVHARDTNGWKTFFDEMAGEPDLALLYYGLEYGRATCDSP